MNETVQTKERERLYFLIPMASSHNLGRDQIGRWATSDPPEAEHLTPLHHCNFLPQRPQSYAEII
jgi:hypothetical protein